MLGGLIGFLRWRIGLSMRSLASRLRLFGRTLFTLGHNRKVAKAMLSQHNWLSLIRQSDDAHLGRAIVRMARLAQQAHVRASGERASDVHREDQAQVEGIDPAARTTSFPASGLDDRIRKEAER